MLIDPEVRRQLEQAAQNMDELHRKLRQWVDQCDAEGRTEEAARARLRLASCDSIRLQLRTLLNELDTAH